MHINKFGPFRVNDLAKENPTFFQHRNYEEEEKEGQLIEYGEG